MPRALEFKLPPVTCKEDGEPRQVGFELEFTGLTLEQTATALGFDAVRICRADEDWPVGERLAEWVEDGRHGDMAWMEATLERRKHPTNMWENARSAIMLSVNYGPESDPVEALEQTSHGNISVYARGADVIEVNSHSTPASRRASDHLPVVARVSFKAEIESAEAS